MGNRLSRIYTRTGDDGTTGLGDGTRVPKDCPRVEAYGAVDELNSWLGLLCADDDLPAAAGDCLREIQHRLFDLGGELAVPGRDVILDDDVTALEQALDRFNAGLPPLKEFILPGGKSGAAHCHLARVACRRAERRVWTLYREQPGNPATPRYLNRLSDLLFVIARCLARTGGGSEILWQARGKP